MDDNMTGFSYKSVKMTKIKKKSLKNYYTAITKSHNNLFLNQMYAIPCKMRYVPN
jgi:hypothetical protein